MRGRRPTGAINRREGPMGKSLTCVLMTWCKRPSNHNGPCRRKATKADVEELLRQGLATEAEKELWNRLK
jgi:hypothetical protein